MFSPTLIVLGLKLVRLILSSDKITFTGGLQYNTQYFKQILRIKQVLHRLQASCASTNTQRQLIVHTKSSKSGSSIIVTER
uniref:Putative secreted protein n=1 Tax=Ixodes ricinus TaxID=34613 RepID=A0A6B0UDJ0_IXORI